MDKIKLFLAALMLSSAVAVNAQEQQEKNVRNCLGIGFNISQNQKDFGVGINVISPYFCRQILAVRAGANLQWLEYADPGSGTTVWKEYASIQVGIRGREFIIEDKISVYGEGGIVMVVPNKAFSARSLAVGGYGLFGFEFHASERFSYFIEAGGMGTGATADRLPSKPVYSNGFTANVGFRFML